MGPSDQSADDTNLVPGACSPVSTNARTWSAFSNATVRSGANLRDHAQKHRCLVPYDRPVCEVTKSYTIHRKSWSTVSMMTHREQQTNIRTQGHLTRHGKTISRRLRKRKVYNIQPTHTIQLNQRNEGNHRDNGTVHELSRTRQRQNHSTSWYQ